MENKNCYLVKASTDEGEEYFFKTSHDLSPKDVRKIQECVMELIFGEIYGEDEYEVNVEIIGKIDDVIDIDNL